MVNSPPLFRSSMACAKRYNNRTPMNKTEKISYDICKRIITYIITLITQQHG